MIDEVIAEEDLTGEGPADITLKRWRQWAKGPLTQAEGKLRSAAYRILDLTDSFLGSRESLVKKIQERLHDGWLSSVIRIVRHVGE